MLVVVLAVAVAGELVHSRQTTDVTVAATAVATGLVAALITAATTASGPQYSVHGSLLAGALMVLVALWVRMASAVTPRARWLAAAIPTCCIASAWLLQPTGDAPTWQLDTRIASGPWSGVTTTSARAADLTWLQAAVDEHARPG